MIFYTPKIYLLLILFIQVRAHEQVVKIESGAVVKTTTNSVITPEPPGFLSQNTFYL
jgi:hypothetical protein